MNATSYFYAHSDQWRYEKLGLDEVLSPLADKNAYGGSMIDYNVRAERMGWLPSSPQLQRNPIQIVRTPKAGMDPVEYLVKSLTEGSIKMSCTDPDHPDNWPRNLLVWRSICSDRAARGMNISSSICWAPAMGCRARTLARATPSRPKWPGTKGPEGKLDLLVTLDFRMSTTCLYSDVVLPTATWYEKNDLNTSDMHPFIHPLSTAVDPAWESRSDWEIYKGLAKAFSEVRWPFGCRRRWCSLR